MAISQLLHLDTFLIVSGGATPLTCHRCGMRDKKQHTPSGGVFWPRDRLWHQRVSDLSGSEGWTQSKNFIQVRILNRFVYFLVSKIVCIFGSQKFPWYPRFSSIFQPYNQWIFKMNRLSPLIEEMYDWSTVFFGNRLIIKLGCKKLTMDCHMSQAIHGRY